MAGELRGFFQTASNNAAGFTNSSTNDLLMYTSSSNQKILIGTKQNLQASLVVNSNTVNINETVNVTGDINFTGSLRQNGALFQSGGGVGWSSNTTNVFSFSNVTIGASNGPSKLNVIGSGGTLYMNASSTNPTNGVYIDINNSNTALTETVRLVMGVDGVGFSSNNGQAGIGTWTNHPVAFFTSNSERMRITSAGNVGIGTSNPKSVLHVAGTGGLCVTGTLNGGGYIGSNGVYLGDYGNDRPAIELVGSTETFLDFTTSNQDFAGRIRYDHGNNSMFFHTNANTTPRLTLNNAGNVGIGTSSPEQKLDVAGTIRATGDIIAFSDSNYKCNIEPLQDAIGKIKALNGYTFNFKTNLEKRHIGVLAQEVEKVVPEAVYTSSEDGKKSVAYGNMIALLIEGVKNLEKQIQEIKETLRH